MSLTLTAIPEGCLQDHKENTLNRYQRVQQLLQHFWSRWHKEYLTELQTRVKWQKHQSSNQLNVGSIVLIKEDNLPPLKWQMGRVIELHPGKDNVVRVVSVKTNHGAVKRAVTKICILPLDNNI